MDGLNFEERALAWASSWDPSFAGIAIVNKDFTFRSVNPQFCDILGVSPAELIGTRFEDITPIEIRKLDVKNANLVMQGKINSYLLPKCYEFENGKRVNVILLVTGVYSTLGEFLFFVSRIMMDAEKDLPDSMFVTQNQEPKSVLDFIKCYAPIFAAVGTGLGALILYVIEHIKK